MTMSRIDSGEFTFDVRPVDLGRLVERAAGLQQGGRMWLETSEGGGSAFSYSVPEVTVEG